MSTMLRPGSSGPSESLPARLRSKVVSQPRILVVNDLVFIRKLLEQGALATVGTLLALSPHNILLRLLGVTLLGAVFARNLELLHECMHFSALKSRKANQVAGTLLGLPLLTSFEAWRLSHARHHADVRNEFQFNFDAIRSWTQLLRWWLMIDHFRDSLTRILFCLPGIARTGDLDKPEVRRDYQTMAALIVIVTILSACFHSWLFLWLWLFPAAIASIINFHIQLPEHHQCDTSSADALRNTRTIDASRLAAWFVNNNNFHTCHHWIPSVPVVHLARIDDELRRSTTMIRATYPRFFWKFYTNLWAAIRKS